MKRRTVIGVFTVTITGVAVLFISSRTVLTAQQPAARFPVYNPYPPGLLPANLNAEMAKRVLQEIDVIEARAIQRWHSLPPPTRFPARPGPNPPILQGTGTESIETLGELMLFDQNISPGRNQACTSCHMPYAGWSGPIPSVNGTIIAYPGTVHFRAGKRTAQRHTMHRSSLCCNTTKNSAILWREFLGFTRDRIQATKSRRRTGTGSSS